MKNIKEIIKQQKNRQKGITLIALVITIIVLLILAGVTLNMVVGQNGIFNKATTAKEKTAEETAYEQIKLKVLETQTEKKGSATLQDIVEKLESDEQNIYIIKIGKTAKLSKTEGDIKSTTTAEEIETILQGKETIEIIYNNCEVEINKELKITNKGSLIVRKEYTISYELNGGTETIEEQKKMQGDTIKVTSIIPTREGYNFKGWSTTENGEVEYSSEADYTKDQSVVLYAIWEQSGYLLSSKASVGDYVEYPITYGTCTKDNGWRILDIKGDSIRIISTKSANRTCGSNSNLVGYLVNNENWKMYVDEKYAISGVGALSKEEWDTLSGGPNELYHIGDVFWLATYKYNNGVDYVYCCVDSVNGLDYSRENNGMRPVITLKSMIKTNGKNNSGAWILLEK